jgi:hypothetical protein
MYDEFKLHSAACSNACRPVVVHSIPMSIIFQHYKQLSGLRSKKDERYEALWHFGFMDILKWED